AGQHPDFGLGSQTAEKKGDKGKQTRHDGETLREKSYRITSLYPDVSVMFQPLTDNTPLACRPHDHARCVSNALAGAEALCARQGTRLTTLRKRVLELVWASHKPLGAYDILAVLSEEDGRRAAPPTVYRALDFLQANGLVHRIASLNAFIGCAHPGTLHQGQFLICRSCKTAVELEQASISQAIVAGAAQVGFAVENQTVEVVGLCSGCQGA